MAQQPGILYWDNNYTLDLPCGSVALKPGDLLSWESNAIVKMDLVTEDTTFAGVCGGKCGTTDAGKLLPVYLKCWINIDLTSAVYTLGQGLMWAAANQLVDHGVTPANTIARYWGKTSGTITRGKVFVDVPAIGKLFEAIAA